VLPGIRLSAQPLCVGLGVTLPSSMPSGRARANKSAAAALSSPLSAWAGPGGLKSQGPPRLAAHVDLGEFHRTPLLPAQPRSTQPGGLGDQLIWRLLRTGRQPAWSTLPVLGGPCGKVHFCQDCRRPRARPAASRKPRAAAVRLHLQRPPPADLHRQSGQVEIQEVGVLQRRRLGRETPEPSRHRAHQVAREDPPHRGHQPTCGLSKQHPVHTPRVDAPCWPMPAPLSIKTAAGWALAAGCVVRR
jgi:hypothetical protein